jgi:hypothetical protein
MKHANRQKIQFIMRKLNQLKLIQMLELANKDINTVITTAFHMFKRLEKKLHMLSNETKDKKNSQTCRGENSTMSEMNKTLNITNYRLCKKLLVSLKTQNTDYLSKTQGKYI